MRIIINAGDFADALAGDLRKQIPEETGITVEVDGEDVVLGALASQEVAEGLAGSLNRSLPEGLRAEMEGDVMNEARPRVYVRRTWADGTVTNEETHDAIANYVADDEHVASVHVVTVDGRVARYYREGDPIAEAMGEVTS